MTVRELIEELRRWPPSAVVHIDVDASDTVLEANVDGAVSDILNSEEPGEMFEEHVRALGGWEGDRVVRGVSGVRWQSGYKAVAIDAQTYEASENDEANWIEQEHDTKPST